MRNYKIIVVERWFKLGSISMPQGRGENRRGEEGNCSYYWRGACESGWYSWKDKPSSGTDTQKGHWRQKVTIGWVLQWL